VRWSIQKRYQQGIAHCPTTYFLGFDNDEDGNLIINEEQAKTVRRIYRECLEGNGTGLIAKRLTAEGIKTGKGGTVWVGNSVYRILRNEKYCGDMLMQKRVTVDFLTHKRVPNIGQQPQYFIEDHHPAIISREDWNLVQAEVDHRARMNKGGKNEMLQKHSNKTVFSNIMYCGTCGEPFVRRTLTSTRKNEAYLFPAWKCRAADGRVKGKVCHARSYREVAMEHSFMVMLLEMKHGKEIWLEAAKRAIAERDCDEWEKERLEYLIIEIESINETRSKVADSALKSSVRDVYDDMSIDLTQASEAMQSEWEKLNHKKNEALTLKRTLEWLLEEIDSVKDFDPENERIDFRADLFRRIVLRGDVFEDGSIVYELIFGLTRKSTGNEKMVWKIGNE